MTLPVYTKLVKIAGANGRNWPGVIHLNPNAPYRAAVWAQEAYEAVHKLNPFNLLRTRLSKRHKQRMEIMGHEIEVQAVRIVYALNINSVRQREAISMKRGYDGLFADMTKDQIEQLMLANQDAANRWVRKNLNQIKKWV